MKIWKQNKNWHLWINQNLREVEFILFPDKRIQLSISSKEFEKVWTRYSFSKFEKISLIKEKRIKDFLFEEFFKEKFSKKRNIKLKMCYFLREDFRLGKCSLFFIHNFKKEYVAKDEFVPPWLQ